MDARRPRRRQLGAVVDPRRPSGPEDPCREIGGAGGPAAPDRRRGAFSDAMAVAAPSGSYRKRATTGTSRSRTISRPTAANRSGGGRALGDQRGDPPERGLPADPARGGPGLDASGRRPAGRIVVQREHAGSVRPRRPPRLWRAPLRTGRPRPISARARPARRGPRPAAPRARCERPRPPGRGGRCARPGRAGTRAPRAPSASRAVAHVHVEVGGVQLIVGDQSARAHRPGCRRRSCPSMPISRTRS